MFWNCFCIGFLLLFAVAAQDSQNCFVCVNGSRNATCGVDLSNCCATVRQCLRGISDIVINIGSGIYNGSENCQLSISQNTTIKGNGSSETIIDCNSRKMIEIDNNADFVRIESITLRNGASNVGGCISSSAETLIISNCVFSKCRSMNGGAIGGGNVFLTGNNIFEDNEAVYSGGAIYIYTGRLSQLYNTDTVDFLSNSAGESGGALALVNSDMTQGSFNYFRNQAQNGGAVYLKNSNLQTFFVPLRANFTKNKALQIGGAIYSESASAHHILSIDAIYSKNTASFGGAIGAVGDVDIDLYSGIATNNIAYSQGGFLFAVGWDFLNIGIEGFNNSANLTGGGISIATDNEFARFTGTGGNFHGNFIGFGNQRIEQNIYCESSAYACDNCTALNCQSCIDAEGVCDDRGFNQSVCFRSNGCFHGKCYISNNVVCQCEAGYAGENCSLEAESSSENSEEKKRKLWIIPVVLIPLLVIAAVVGFFIYKYSKRPYSRLDF